MAVAFDATSNASAGDVTSLSFNHTCSGTQRLLVVGISWLETTLSASGIFIESVTYHGFPLTWYATVSNGVFVELWYMTAPSAGVSGSVDIVFGGDGIGEGGLGSLVAGAISFTGVDQSTPMSAAAQATGSSTTPSVNITGTSVNNIVLDLLGVTSTTAVTATVDGSQTQRWNGTTAPIGAYIGAGSTETSTAGSVTMSWALSVSKSWAIQAVEILEVSAVLQDVIMYGGLIPVPR